MQDVRIAMSRGWLAMLWLGPPIVLVCAAVTFWSAQRALLATDDEDLARAAERVARTADLYVARIVSDLTMMTTAPDVRAEAKRQSDLPQDATREAVMDADWQDVEDRGYERDIAAILNTRLSLYFRSTVRSTGTILRELLLADRAGRVFAASVRVDNYVQREEEWWPVDRYGFQSCAGAPVACAQFRDIRWDESAGAFGLEVIVPVVAEGELVGVLKAVVDPLELAEFGRLSDRWINTTVRKRNGEALLARGGDRFFGETEIELPRGGEMFVRRAGQAIAVRALSGPMGDYWVATAVTRDASVSATGWVLPAAWLALTVIALLLTATAAGERRDLRRALASPAREVEAV